MHNGLRYILQKSLGFKRYLFWHAVFKIWSLKFFGEEKDFLDFLEKLPEDMIFLDIGAGIGTMTAPMAKKIRGNGEIFAFEPVPCHIDTLKKIISLFGLDNVKVFNYALGDQDGKIDMVIPVKNTVRLWGLTHVIHNGIKDFNEGERFKVKIRRLDSIEELKTTRKKIGVIKIDVENFEYFVLAGGEETIKKHRPLIYIELWDNENRERCFDFTRKLSYNIYVFDKHRLKKCAAINPGSQNFLFLPDDKFS